MPIYEGIITNIEAVAGQDVVSFTCEMGPVRVQGRVPLYPDWEELIGLLNSAFDQKRLLVITYDVEKGTDRLLSVWAPGSRVQGEKHILVWNLAFPAPRTQVKAPSSESSVSPSTHSLPHTSGRNPPPVLHIKPPPPPAPAPPPLTWNQKLWHYIMGT